MNLASLHEHIAKIRPDVISMWQDAEGNVKWDETLPNQEQIAELVASYVAPVVSNIPRSVTNRQIREAMTIMAYQTGNMAMHPNNILNALKSLPDGIAKDIAIQNWEYSNEFIRTNPLISSMAPMLGLTEQSIDQLFLLAASRGV